MQWLTVDEHKILGGAMVIGALIAFSTFMITKFSDYVTISAPEKSAATAKPQK